jgi:sec-independent protein translocase protein TatA
MPQIGGPELLVLLVIVMIFFGVGRLSEVGGAIGRGIREFRKASTGEYDEPAPGAAGAAGASAEPATKQAE